MGGVRPLDPADREFYGDLVLSPTITVEQLAEMYGLPMAVANASRTLREKFHQEFPNGFELGDRLRMGGVELIVRDLDEEGEIAAIGLALEPSAASQPRVALFLRPRQLAKAIGNWWGRQSFRRWQRRQRRPRDAGPGD
jgi:cell volume regulation protein A